MKIASLVFVVALLCLKQGGAAVQQKTVYAVAKVEGRTKKLDGKVYHLIAIRLNPAILLLNTGLGSSVLLVHGSLAKAALANGEKERELEDNGHRVQLLWLCLPEKGAIEVLWGGLADPKEKEAELRDRLIQAGYAPYTVEFQKLPVLKASNAKELLVALDQLTENSK